MSGISGILNIDHSPVAAGDIQNMVSSIGRRGPDTTGCVVTTDARLDKGEERLDSIGIGHGSATEDGQLILLAYHTWDIDCVDYLSGDFVFAIWPPNGTYPRP